MRTVTEHPPEGDLPLWRHPEWAERFGWLAQGTTGAGSGEEPFDLGLSGGDPVGPALERWRALRRALDMPGAVHSRQVHATELLRLSEPLPPGLLVTEGYDGHLTDRPGLLLTVSIADCVPVFLVDARQRAVAALHAGWRGAAGGIVERAVQEMATHYGTRAQDLWLHCGPAICGRCYEVGPEVHRAVRPDVPAPELPTPIDLRAALAERVLALGVPESQISVSAHCTRCGPGEFFSHRAGSPRRQMGVVGIRA